MPDPAAAVDAPASTEELILAELQRATAVMDRIAIALERFVDHNAESSAAVRLLATSMSASSAAPPMPPSQAVSQGGRKK